MVVVRTAEGKKTSSSPNRKPFRCHNSTSRTGRWSMKVFFNPLMSVPSGGYSPSGSKPSAVVADWQAQGLEIEVCDFQAVTESDLCLAHDRRYVRSVLSGRLNNGHGNRLPEVTNACLWTCGSMLAASRQALIDGITCSPSSGFHHAHYASCRSL